MRNDPNSYGTPPASEGAIKSLSKVPFKKEVKKFNILIYNYNK